MRKLTGLFTFLTIAVLLALLSQRMHAQPLYTPKLTPYEDFIAHLVPAPVPLAPPQLVDSIAAILSAGQHLNVSQGLDVMVLKQSPHYETYLKQREAIEAAGTYHLTALIPQLLNYCDYPSNDWVRPLHLLSEVKSQRPSAQESWPAYKSILQMGEAAFPVLQAFVKDNQQPLQLRLTALQILWEIDREEAHALALQLSDDAKASGQPGAALRVDFLFAGELPFWGKVDFQPVTLSPAQVADLLASQRHLEKISTILFNYSWPSKFRSMLSQGSAIEADYALYLQQCEAIRTAGELRLPALLPNLVDFMDYQEQHSDWRTASIIAYPLAYLRHKYPALDAILKMGYSAVAPLQAIVGDNKEHVTRRFSALQALHYLNAEAAQTSSQALLVDCEKVGDTRTCKRIRAMLKNYVWLG